MTNKVHYTEAGKRERYAKRAHPDRCRHCQIELRPHYKRVYDPGMAGVLRYYSHTSSLGPPSTVWYMAFFGNYGHKGNNTFCSKDCGYKWALKAIWCHTIRTQPTEGT